MTEAPSLRREVLEELSAIGVKGYTVVPERLSTIPGGRAVRGVIVTTNRGHRCRLLESGGMMTLEEDTTPDDVCPTWLRVESAPASTATIVRRMVELLGDA